MKTLLLATAVCVVVSGQTETRSFKGVKQLLVQNVNGAIEIVAGSGDTVEMTAVREVRGSGAEAVKLVAEQSGDQVKIYVDYPCDHGWPRESRNYSVKYSFRLEVPAAAILDARTVNGGVTAVYREYPRQAVHLTSINGKVEGTFGPAFGANVHTDTMNGSVYSDFEVTALPARVSVDHANGMTRYRSDGGSFRIGQGGPELEMKTLNGNIFIRSERK